MKHSVKHYVRYNINKYPFLGSLIAETAFCPAGRLLAATRLVAGTPKAYPDGEAQPRPKGSPAERGKICIDAQIDRAKRAPFVAVRAPRSVRSVPAPLTVY